MKIFHFLTIVILCIAFAFSACNDSESERIRQEAKESIQTSTSETAPPSDLLNPPATPTPEPAQNAEGVWHYTCAKGCAGGAAKAGPCAICGGTLAHNTEYHNTKATTSPTTTTTTTPPAPGAITPPPTTEPAQNAKGVWHYTCAKGCAGGGGKAGPCGTCGGTLAHNTEYHK